MALSIELHSTNKIVKMLSMAINIHKHILLHNEHTYFTYMYLNMIKKIHFCLFIQIYGQWMDFLCFVIQG